MTALNPLLQQDLDLDDRTIELVYPPDAFRREDESDDRSFYAAERIVSHLDEAALAAVEAFIGGLVVEPSPVVLDLMASWDSHLPDHIRPARLVGLGLNEHELQRNKALTDHVIHDLNRQPRLPFPSETFDVVLNTVSVDYLTRPFEVFGEVGRILKPGGLFMVIFSNRYFPPKVVSVWREASEQERVFIVEDYFKAVRCFAPPQLGVSQGRPRPADDQYAGLGLPSDPIYAVFADKVGGAARRPRRVPSVAEETPLDAETVARRKKHIARTMRCPYCNWRLAKWAVPQTPFTEYDVEHLHVCFNDHCPYLVRGWETMAGQGNLGFSQRFMYLRERDSCGSLPISSLDALRDGIVQRR
jgi:SAM-dependent methyltransferase